MCFASCFVSYCYVYESMYHHTSINKQLETQILLIKSALFAKHTRYMFRPHMVTIMRFKNIKNVNMLHWNAYYNRFIVISPRLIQLVPQDMMQQIILN